MAGQDKSQKTEKPTKRKLDEARKEGQVPRSSDLVPWLMVLIATFVMPAFVSRARNVLGARLLTVREADNQPADQVLAEASGGMVADLMTLLLPVLVGGAVIALVVSFAQTGPVLSPKALKPKPKALNPITGIKRIFSRKGQWEAAKATMRMAAVTAVAVPLVIGSARDLSGRPQFNLSTALPYLGGQLLQLGRLVAVLGLMITVADYAMQRRNHMSDLRMSKEELKQEHKQSEGDPTVKRRIRSAQQSMSRNRMLSNVAGADVIVVNPTHFAVALRYDQLIGVPTVLAKGADLNALRIRREGLEAAIPVVECKPLARALFAACNVGEPIPKPLFQGVAIVLAFVHRLGHRRSYGGVHHLDSGLSELGLPDPDGGSERTTQGGAEQPMLASTVDGATDQ